MTLGFRILLVLASIYREASTLARYDSFLALIEQQGHELVPYIPQHGAMPSVQKPYIYQSDLRHIISRYGNPDYIFIEEAAIINNRPGQEQHTLDYISNETKCNIHVITDWQEAIAILQEAVMATDETGMN